jgi:hypothetical protein
MSYCLGLGITAFSSCLGIYLLLEAAATHEVLGALCHELLKEEYSP